MDPLHTASATDLANWSFVPTQEEDATSIWSRPETMSHAQLAPEFDLGGYIPVSTFLSRDITSCSLFAITGNRLGLRCCTRKSAPRRRYSAQSRSHECRGI